MTEAEWLACTDPTPMVEFLLARGASRELRLFACALCRRVWHLLADKHLRKAVLTAERNADGRATDRELEFAYNTAGNVRRRPRKDRGVRAVPVEEGEDAARHARRAAFDTAAANPFWYRIRLSPTAHTYGPIDDVLIARLADDPGLTSREETRAQVALLRDVAGNPFRPVAIPVDPGWLDAQDGQARMMAQAIRDERRFADLPVLADALEDAGCTSADLLDHFRQPEEHAHGCWALDLLLGKS